MTQKTAKKGPKFGAINPAGVPGENGKARFEVDIPEPVQALIKAEEKIANDGINAYIQERNRAFLAKVETILTTCRAMLPDVPADKNLKANEGYTKLIEV